MATYLVGDVQGCFLELQALLTRVKFSPKTDTLFLAGDLVARGDDSLAVLRLVKSLGSSARCVLGNHDLHLLAGGAGVRRIKEKDKTAPIFAAADKDKLLHWLRQQPLLVHCELPNNSASGFVMTHAGIAPAWDLATAINCAHEVEALLKSDNYVWLLEHMYGDEPDTWSINLQGIERYRFIINAFTRMRFCTPSGALDMQCKLPPEQVSENQLLPWFNVKNRQAIEPTLIFGHWAALNGYHKNNIIGLDTGCVWGGNLTMLRWEDAQYFTQAKL